MRKSTAVRGDGNPPAATGNQPAPGLTAGTSAITTRPDLGPSLAGERSAASAEAMRRSLKETRVGEVRVIGGGRRFVLVEIGNRPDLPVLTPGAELHSRLPAGSLAYGGEETARLRVSPERCQPFIVADVLSGEPHVDDLVFFLPDAPVRPLTPAPLRETADRSLAPPPAPSTRVSQPVPASNTTSASGTDSTSRWHATATVHDN